MFLVTTFLVTEINLDYCIKKSNVSLILKLGLNVSVSFATGLTLVGITSRGTNCCGIKCHVIECFHRTISRADADFLMLRFRNSFWLFWQSDTDVCNDILHCMCPQASSTSNGMESFITSVSFKSHLYVDVFLFVHDRYQLSSWRQYGRK